jgi:hypothetical protein
MSNLDLPQPPPRRDPDAVTLDRVRELLRHGGDVGYVLEVARSAALAKGKAALDPRWTEGRPAQEKAARQFLLAVQAAAEELDRLAQAVAEGEKVEG